MKMIKKAIALGLGLVLMGSATFAQSLADAKKAIDAEQYQKATTMLKTLTTTQPNKPENFFSLGDVYLRTDDVDSARVAFTKGVTADAKYALNYVGLGQADLQENNPTSAKTNFDKAISLGAKDYKTYLYIGKAYIAQRSPDYAAALPFLTKADELDTKDLDAEVFIALGDFYALQKKNSEALGPYLRAVDINPALLRSNVQIGRMYTNAINYVDAEAKLNEVIAADPNYGPAYRELAETQLRWSYSDEKKSVAEARRASALENYRKYLSLTDKSFDSRLRYAQFLVYGADWKTLEEVAAGLATNNPNPTRALLISRFRGYASYENGNYPQSVQYMTDVFEKGKKEPDRIFPSDYAYLGKALEKTGQDSLAIISLKKATELDSTNADAMQDIAVRFGKAKKFGQALDVLNFMVKENPKSFKTLTNYFYIGQYNYYDYIYKNRDQKSPSKDILVAADSAYAYVSRLNPEEPAVLLGRANVAIQMDDPKAPAGLAKPFYEKYIELVTVTKPEKAASSTRGLIEAYGYLGYLIIDTDKEKAKEYFNKVLALDPNSKFAQDNLKYLNPPPPAATPKKTPIKK